MEPPSFEEGTRAGHPPKGRHRHAILAIVVAVVLVGAGGIAYLLSTPGAFSGSNSESHSGTHSTCSPPTSPICRGVSPPPPVANVSIPFETVEAGQPVPVEVGLPGFFTILSNGLLFGDGTQTSGTALNVTHTYSQGGQYYVYASVQTTTRQTFTDLGALAPVRVTSPPPQASATGDQVATAGKVVSNNTAAQNATAVLRPGGSVTLSAWISAGPENRSTRVGSPYFAVGPGGSGNLTLGNPTGSGDGPDAPLTVTVGVAADAVGGEYPVSFVVPTSLVLGGQTVGALSNYTFTVFVGANATGGGGAALVLHPLLPPDRGTLNVYREAPGGSRSEDPAIDYETVGMEPILNVYQTLVTYNGSSAGPSPSDFVPDLATCVPGGSQCTSLYGNDLVTSTGNYTFVIDPAAQFYDAATGAHYGVYPADVVFSLARSCLFSTYPGYQVNPGWIQCQALLPNGNVADPVGTLAGLAPNASWDGGLHAPLNNTPGNILSAMTVNSTEDCPQVSGVFAGNGCVTFNTRTLTGTGWSYFLELMADPLGASVMSCAWASANGGGLPGFTVVGDHCTVPAANSLAPTAWDPYMTYAAPATYNLYLQWHMMGSGPYYLANLIITDAYYLQANPYWGGTTCVGGVALGCLPGAFNASRPTYIPTVNVIWESSATQGESAYAAGVADFASIPLSDTGFLLQLEGQGTVTAGAIRTLNVSVLPFALDFNVSVAQQASGARINVPGTFLQDLNLRQFLVNAFPYAAEESSLGMVDGLPTSLPLGGAIPAGEGPFYPGNLSWPGGTPSPNASQRGSAAYWWAQFEKDPIYAHLAASGCLAPGQGPCTVPFGIPSPSLGPLAQLYSGEVYNLSNGAIRLVPYPLSGPSLTYEPGDSPQAISVANWGPSYPDPTDSVTPFYLANSSYPLGDALSESLLGAGPGGNLTMAGEYYGSACAGGGTLAAPNGWAMVVTLGCQGWAYLALTHLLREGAACAPPACGLTDREMLYSNAEAVAGKLGLYVYVGQQDVIYSYSRWIDPAGINTNPMIGGVGDQTWYTVSYQTVPP